MPSLPPGVVINDPRNLEFVFKNEGVFAKGEFMKKPLWDLFGEYLGSGICLDPLCQLEGGLSSTGSHRDQFH